MTEPFFKLVGAGNDFILFPKPRSQMSFETNIAELCDRHFGIGADGVIFWDSGSKTWDFFNSDQSSAEMCGNAARAFALWLQQHESHTLEWNTAIGKVYRRHGANVSVQWTLPDFGMESLKVVELNNLIPEFSFPVSKAKAWFCNSGVPHLVILVPSTLPAKKTRDQWSPLLRSHSMFANGTNVTWHSTSTKETVSFERGVEGETLACGSGAVASSLALRRESNSSHVASHELCFPGGTLTVTWEGDSQFWLSGPASIPYSGQWNKSAAQASKSQQR